MKAVSPTVNVLELRGVTKEHPGTPPVVALRDVTVSVGAGEFVAVTGPSGSGSRRCSPWPARSSARRAEACWWQAKRSTPRSDAELSGVRSATVGFVFQQFHLLPDALRAAQRRRRLALPGRPGCGTCSNAPVRRWLRWALRTGADHRPGELSGGECQRAAIARAIVGEPVLLLADEPTGNLDSATGAEIVSLLAGLHRRGTTVLLVTHNDELARRAPRCIALRDGGIERDER